MFRIDLKKHKLLLELLIVLTVTSLIAVLCLFNVGEPFELKTIDLRFKLRGPTKNASNAVEIIYMGDESIEALGRWPWRRNYHALLVHVLSLYKPAAICFDVLFTEPDNSFPEDDRFLAKASKDSKLTYFPFYFYHPEKLNEADYELLKRKVSISGKIKDGALPYEDEFHGELYKSVAMTTPIPRLIDAFKGTGFVNAPPDSDGTTRRVPLVIEYRRDLYLSYAFGITCDYLGVDRKDIKVRPGKYVEIKKSKIGPIKIPINEKGQYLVNFDGGIKAFNWYSFVQILTSYRDMEEGKKPAIDLNKLKDKILFIGLTATGTVDIRATPFSPTYPLVGVLANTASNILNKKFLAETGTTVNLLILFALGIIIGLVSHKLKPLVGAAFSIFMACVYFGVAYWLFAFQGICLKVIYPMAVIMIGYLSIVVFKFATEEKEKKWIKNVFQRYVSSQVVDEMLSDADKLSLGGSKKKLTIFFADIRGFTSMSEKMKPEDVVTVLNRIFTIFTEILFKYEGTLDKFMGDCVMAIWGAPIELRNPEELALRTALEMQEKMKGIQEELIKEGRHPVGFGIGINTGEVIVGNMGSLQHMDYTVIGDEVNLTSRIEGCAERGQTLITESVYEKMKDMIKVNKLEPVKVKGKVKPIPVYEVLSIS